ncbi:MAG: peptide chain release factor aRF-1 [Candidatus Micrarchaeia archaeon]
MSSKDDAKLDRSRREIKRYIAELSKIRGSGTELISVYIPPKYPIGDIAAKLRAEYSQASNIKSKQTRNNVLGALERILNFLKHFNEPPETGIAIFVGNVSKNPGESDIKTYYIIPPDPINVQLYRCDSVFYLEPLLVFTKPKEVYGLLAIDGSDATIAVLEGKNYRILRRIESQAASKTTKGGQSAMRYQRLVEHGKEDYYKKVGEAMDQIFLSIPNLKGVIVGGPGPIKEYFLEGGYFNYQIKVLGKVDTGYADDYGIQEMVGKVDEIIQEHEAARERRIVNQFLEKVSKGVLATYGVNEVYAAMQEGRVDTLLVSEEIKITKLKYTCTKCGETGEKLVVGDEIPDKVACKCGGVGTVVEKSDVIEELENLAESTGAKIEFISADTHEGAQFLRGFLGIGAILRY